VQKEILARKEKRDVSRRVRKKEDFMPKIEGEVVRIKPTMKKILAKQK